MFICQWKIRVKRKILSMNRRKKRYIIFIGSLVAFLWLIFLIIRTWSIECYVIYNEQNIIKTQEINKEQWLFLPSDINSEDIKFYINVHRIFSSKYRRLKLVDATGKVEADKIITNTKITSININSIAARNEKTGSWKLNVEGNFGNIYG